MPAAGATTIGTGRLPGQEAIDLSVCLAILKKAIVMIPVLIMIILYLIKNNMAYTEETDALSNSTVISDLVPFNQTLIHSKLSQLLGNRSRNLD